MHKHFTATAFIIDSKNRTLLLWHKHLKRWMPPGGHVDPDEIPEETARRECKEETGLDVEIIGDSQDNLFSESPEEGEMLKKPIAMLMENIPAREQKNEPAHQHMDFLFIAKPIDESQEVTLAEHEGDKIRWFTKEEVEQLGDDAMFTNVKAYIKSLL